MGLVKVTAEIGAPAGEMRPVEFLVDTGSTYTVVSPELAQDLGLELPGTGTIWTAGNVRTQIPLGYGRIRLMGREEPAFLGVMDVPMPLLGAISLQMLRMKVDLATESLELTEPYPMP